MKVGHFQDIFLGPSFLRHTGGCLKPGKNQICLDPSRFPKDKSQKQLGRARVGHLFAILCPWMDPKSREVLGIHLDGASVWSWSINDLKSDRFQTTAFCWTKCQKQRCYETWNMTSRETFSFNPQWVKLMKHGQGSPDAPCWCYRKTHEHHLRSTLINVATWVQHVCSEETSKIICPNLTLPQAGFHLMWFSDLPEYADATRRSKRNREKPATTPQQPASGWVGVFPVSFFFGVGGHV